MERKNYLVGRYQYTTMRRPATVVVRWEDRDALPPTMKDMSSVWASNKTEALRIYRDTLALLGRNEDQPRTALPEGKGKDTS